MNGDLLILSVLLFLLDVLTSQGGCTHLGKTAIYIIEAATNAIPPL